MEIFYQIRFEQEASSGDVDSELVRKVNYGKIHKYLTRVVETLFEFNVSIYSFNLNLKVKNIFKL